MKKQKRNGRKWKKIKQWEITGGKRNQERETPSTNGDKGRAMEEVGAKKGNLM